MWKGLSPPPPLYLCLSLPVSLSLSLSLSSLSPSLPLSLSHLKLHIEKDILESTFKPAWFSLRVNQDVLGPAKVGNRSEIWTTNFSKTEKDNSNMGRTSRTYKQFRLCYLLLLRRCIHTWINASKNVENTTLFNPVSFRVDTREVV